LSSPGARAPFEARRIYLRNAGFWNSLNIDRTPFAPAVDVDEIVVALYPPAVSAQRSLLAREFVGYLGSLVGRDKVHEIDVWPDTSALNPAMRRMPTGIPVAEIETAVSGLGGFYPGGEIRRYHTAMNFLEHKHFVILSGLSGTGKTQLALKYARAVHGVTSNDAPDPLLFVCPVRPEWTDPTGLTGYYDVLSNRYVVPPFLEAVLVATAHRDSPVFVVLDELNLARVEHYFSDVLSCVETGEPLQLHSNSVPLEGTNRMSIRAAIAVPNNLYITGTVNVDETTNPVSNKVLDRAMVIDMSNVELAGFLDDLVSRDPELQGARAAIEARLLAVQSLMVPHGLGFGYRVAEEVVRYQAFATRHLQATPDAVIDDLMVQKVLVKLRGTETQRRLLTDLTAALAGLEKSQALLNRLTDELTEFGSFQAPR
jgi:5-methylcytosine-specific restriction protein B